MSCNTTAVLLSHLEYVDSPFWTRFCIRTLSGTDDGDDDDDDEEDEDEDDGDDDVDDPDKE